MSNSNIHIIDRLNLYRYYTDIYIYIYTHTHTHIYIFEIGLIKQFIKDVDWGPIDYLLVDTPPGTSDEHLSIIQYLRASTIDGAVVIGTPQVGHSLINDLN